MTEHRTTCPYCGVGCGIVVRRDAAGLHLSGDATHPANRGVLCSKGRTLLAAQRGTAGRLLHPELRLDRGASRQCAGWDAALDLVAARFQAAVAQHGPDSVALYVSGQCLTEEYHLANLFTRGVLGSPNIDTNSRLCMSSAVAGYTRSLGSDSVPGCYEDLDLADTYLVCGSNMAWTHPILFQRVEARRRVAAARLVVVDPRRTATAEAADLHLQLQPGTDVALYLGLARALRDAGQVDQAWVAAHTAGWAELSARLDAWSVDRAAAICDVPASAIRQAALWLTGRWMSLWTMGLNQAEDGTDRNVALINLSLMTGTIGKPGCGPFSLTGQPNAMGGREAGGLATILPGHRRLDDPAHRAAVEDGWGVPRGRIPARKGLTAIELFEAARAGRIRALWIIATNPIASLPHAARIDAALAACPFVVVQDAFVSDTTPYADVLLPAATWLEKTGAMTNSERRVHLVEQVVQPPGEARPDWRILAEVIRRCGHPAPWRDVAEVYAEHARLSAGTDCDVSGLSHGVIRAQRAVSWPAPAGVGTPRLFTDGRFHHADGRARLIAVDWQPTGEATTPELPLQCVTARIRDQWHYQTRSGRVARLNAAEPRPVIDLHPADAAARGIAAGDIVAVEGRRGELRLAARLDEGLRPGVVSLPMHWGPRLAGEAGRSNAVTEGRLDPLSKEPDLKRSAVQVRRYRPPARRITVVGAGAAALAFAQAHVAACPDDRITVVGAEPDGFYNRVALPHLIGGAATWDDLRREVPQQVTLCTGQAVTALDPEQGVRLADGRVIAHDLCVLATGSRPAAVAGVAGLRNRADAARIQAAAQPGRRAAIIGAGVLALELADALHRRGMQVALLIRGDRVLGRLIDATAAGLVAAALAQRGIELRFRTPAVVPPDADLVVAAIGTEPETTLAASAGLSVAGGIVVDARMMTAHPQVAAMGECAVCDGVRVGTTAGATAQAQALARHLAGDAHAPWRPVPEACILKVEGLPLAAIGVAEPGPGDQAVRFSDPAAGVCQQAIVRDDRLVGVQCVGDVAPFAALAELVQHGTELEDQRHTLLRGAALRPVAGKLVCSCRQVGADTIIAAVAAGSASVDAVCRATSAGTGCGSCRGEIARMLRGVSR